MTQVTIAEVLHRTANLSYNDELILRLKYNVN